jgi:hypothetical protein
MTALDADNSGAGGAPRSIACLPPWVHAFAWGGMVVLTLLMVETIRGYQGRDVWNG